MIDSRIFFIGVLPLILLQLVLIVVALWQLKTKGVKNLTPILWVIIILCVNLVGPIIFLTVGRNANDQD